jgi:putative redox protein
VSEDSIKGKTMTARLARIGTAAFEATGRTGGKLVVDGSPDIGGEGRGMRPMELLLTAVASCSAMDVVSILRKQKEPLEDLTIEIEGERAPFSTNGPTPFVRMNLVFFVKGDVDPSKLERAVGLAVDKYCSVRASLGPGVDVTWETRRVPV